MKQIFAKVLNPPLAVSAEPLWWRLRVSVVAGRNDVHWWWILSGSGVPRLVMIQTSCVCNLGISKTHIRRQCLAFQLYLMFSSLEGAVATIFWCLVNIAGQKSIQTKICGHNFEIYAGKFLLVIHNGMRNIDNDCKILFHDKGVSISYSYNHCPS